MQITIPIKPLSINQAHQGRHIKTKEFLQYEKHVSFLLPICPREIKVEECFVKYVFYIKNYKKSDTGNFEKLITDILVKREYLKDDRFIKAMYLEKVMVEQDVQEKIIIDIVPYADRYKILKSGVESLSG